jgi:hypothetical protein
MNRLGTLAIGTIVLAALTLSAQQNSGGTAGSQQQQTAGTAVDGHLRMLTEKLELTDEQQVKMRPIIQQFLEGQQKLAADKNLSEEQRSASMNKLREQANKQAHQVLSADQSVKLEQMEQEGHAKAGTN